MDGGWLIPAVEQIIPIVIDNEDIVHRRYQGRSTIRNCNEHPCSRISNLMLHPLLWVKGINWNYPASGTQYPIPGDNKVDGVRKRNGDWLSGLSTGTREAGGDPVGTICQMLVADCPSGLALDHCDLVIQ